MRHFHPFRPRYVLHLFVVLLAIFFLTGCATHEPLPRLNYQEAPQLGAASSETTARPTPTTVTFEAGASIGHSLTSYALMPGGYAMPIKSGPSPVTAFNEEDQAAFVENLARVLTERGAIELVAREAQPAATITVKFLKIEHFPDMQDYVLDALVVARAAGKTYEKVHHVTTIDQANLVARMFQHAIDGRRRAAELLLASVVPELEEWYASTASPGTDAPGILVPLPFERCAREIAQFLAERYARPSTFWKDGISVAAVMPSRSVAMIELRWSDSDVQPPFCVVDIYASGDSTRVVIRERNTLLSARAHVAEALEEYVRDIRSQD